VSLIEPAPWPLSRFVPEPVGRALQRALAGLGVEIEVQTAGARGLYRGPDGRLLGFRSPGRRSRTRTP
jgi:hypothetical protein